MITPAGWLTSPLFLRVDGVPGKVYTQANSGANGLACHSIVGEEADFLDGVPNRFLDESKNPDGSYTAYAAASVMFVLRKRMAHIQMYPVDMSTWTSGGREANTTTWAMEAEGGPIGNEREPLTEHQIAGFLAIARAWEWKFGRKLMVGRTVWAHWQLAKILGYAATACESGRYAEAWARLANLEEGGLSMEDKARLARLERLMGGNGIDYEGERLVGEDALAKADERGWSAFLGIGELRGHVGILDAAISDEATFVPEHTHEAGKVARP